MSPMRHALLHRPLLTLAIAAALPALAHAEDSPSADAEASADAARTVVALD